VHVSGGLCACGDCDSYNMATAAQQAVGRPTMQSLHLLRAGGGINRRFFGRVVLPSTDGQGNVACHCTVRATDRLGKCGVLRRLLPAPGVACALRRVDTPVMPAKTPARQPPARMRSASLSPTAEARNASQRFGADAGRRLWVGAPVPARAPRRPPGHVSPRRR
jgi:hypothetical protein